MESESSPRRRVVVDGSNIATEGRTAPSLSQLDAAIMAFLEEFPGFTPSDVTVVVDATFSHRIDPSEVAAFEQAVEHGEMVTPPAGAVGRGDGFILRIAEKAGALVLSNDSFQEFHAERPWLFEPGRLIGGKPVPGVGWVFTPRTPVRGVKSRAVTSRSKRAAQGSQSSATADGNGKAEATTAKSTRRSSSASKARKADTNGSESGSSDGKASKTTKTAKAAKTTKATKAKKASKADAEGRTDGVDEGLGTAKATGKAAKATKSAKTAKGNKAATKAVDAVDSSDNGKTGKTTKSTKAVKAKKAAKAEKATKAEKVDKVAPAKAVAATKVAKAKGKAAVKAAAAKTATAANDKSPSKTPKLTRTGKSSSAREGSDEALNDPSTFLNFIAEHAVGSTFEGTVTSFTSHGAHVSVDGMLCHIPLRGLGSPPPSRARQVLTKGETREFVLISLDAARRRAELALPGVRN
jgi:hypothetical protein